jgi:hypothetical protein
MVNQQLSKDELRLINKYRNNKIIQWIFLLIIMIILSVIMIAYILLKESVHILFSDIIWDILFEVLFVYTAVYCINHIRKLYNVNIETLKVEKAIITEKQSLKSKDLINRSRYRYVAAETDNETTLYAICSQKAYDKVIINKSVGLFFTLVDNTKRVVVL